MHLFRSLKTTTGPTMFVGLNQQISGGTGNRQADNTLCYRGAYFLASNLMPRQSRFVPADGELCYRGAFAQSSVSSVASDSQQQIQSGKQALCYRGVQYSK